MAAFKYDAFAHSVSAVAAGLYNFYQPKPRLIAFLKSSRNSTIAAHFQPPKPPNNCSFYRYWRDAKNRSVHTMDTSVFSISLETRRKAFLKIFWNTKSAKSRIIFSGSLQKTKFDKNLKCPHCGQSRFLSNLELG